VRTAGKLALDGVHTYNPAHRNALGGSDDTLPWVFSGPSHGWSRLHVL